MYRNILEITAGISGTYIVNGIYYLVSIPWIVAIMMYCYVLKRGGGSYNPTMNNSGTANQSYGGNSQPMNYNQNNNSPP